MDKNKNDFPALSRLDMAVFTYDETDSTALRAREYAVGGGTPPAVFIANSQTQGRGRLGRSFYSPKDTGIYLSMLLSSPEDQSHILSMTAAAAVATRRAILLATGIDTKIKWVNDIYIGNKKIAGILAESFFAQSLRFISVGVGINLSTEDFPPELCASAGSLMDGGASREGLAELKRKLTSALTLELFTLLSSPPTPSLMEEYRSASAVLGKRVRFWENGTCGEGVAEDIDPLGALILRLEGGDIKRLASGEITLRMAEDENKNNGEYRL